MKVLIGLFRVMRVVVVVALLVVVILVVQGRGLATRHIDYPLPQLRDAPDSTLIPRGRHIVEIVCASCHAPDLARPDVMSGGAHNAISLPGGPSFGTLYAPNLTPGGLLSEVSDAEISRAIRSGVSSRGRALLVMPSPSFHTMSDRDVAALIAFMRSQPPVRHEVAKRELNLLAYFVLGLHKFEDSVMGAVSKPIPDVPQDSIGAYGEYTATMLGCSACHGLELHGGVAGQLPPLGPSLTRFVSLHPLPAFELALRQGVNSRGAAMDPSLMPWTSFSRLTDLEVRAIYEYLKSLPR